MRLIALLALGAALAGCGRRPSGGIMTVSVIGPAPDLAAASAPPLTAPEAVLADATGLGPVRLDDEGEVVPGLALRWAIADDGLDLILRIDDTRGLAAPAVARRLRAVLRQRRSDPLARFFADLGTAAAVTDQVVEFRLGAVRPDILELLARPRFAALAPGAGPFRAMRRDGAVLLVPQPGGATGAILLRGEPAGRAVARFAAGRADLVLGGGFDDLAVARAAALPEGRLVFDAAVGLFGFAVRDAHGPAATAAVLQALGLAIDRDRIVAALAVPGLAKATTVAGSTVEPPLAARRIAARRLLANTPAASLRIRVALPTGAGASLLFRLVQADWAAVGVAAERVPAAAPADLALIDEVLPAGERARAACAASAPCDPADPHALLAPPFLAIAAPLRWSLVAPHVRGFGENSLATHPLDRLGVR